MKLHLDDPDVKVAGLVGILINYGREYVNALPPNAFFILNHIFVYQTVFWTRMMLFGVVYVALVALSVPLNPEGQVRQYIRDLAYLFLYTCSAALVWTAFFPGMAYGNPILWNNFGTIYFAGLTAMYLVFMDWRHGIVRRAVRNLRRSTRSSFDYSWKSLKEPRPAASVLGVMRIRQVTWETLLVLYPIVRDLYQMISRYVKHSRLNLRAIAAHLVFVIPLCLLFGSFPGSAISKLASPDPALNLSFRYGFAFFAMFAIFRLGFLLGPATTKRKPSRREGRRWHHIARLPVASIL